jgi:hypothetical protein
LNGGQATLALHVLAAGSHLVTASYGGDASHMAGATGSVTLVVRKSTTTTGLMSSPRPSAVGETVTLTATLTSDVPGASGAADAANGDLDRLDGIVTFKDGAITIGTAPLSAGSAALTIGTLAAGTHTLTASYGGASNYATSASSPLIHQVGATPQPDGGSTSDAGTSPTGGGGGCGCRLGDRVPSGAAALGAGIAALLWARRRERSRRS